MPMVRIDLRAGKPEHYRQALIDGVYRALRDTFEVPEDDQFMLVREYEPANFRYGASYLGIARSSDLVLIQLTVSNTRPLPKKRALYRRIVELLGADPGVRPEDVFINLVEVAPENWSMGLGETPYA